VVKYYTPFLSPGPSVGLGPKEIRDVLPENNGGVPVVPQILTNRAEDFIKSAEILKEYGYQEINLNLGCPSGTVTAKKKGSGLLAYPDELDRLLDGIFSAGPVKKGEIHVSVKTRIGKTSPEEWPRILEIYNQYPMKELTVHPRVQKDFYKNTPNLEAFSYAVGESRNPLVYNGDIFTVEDYLAFRERFPDVEKIMAGRGIIRNPELAEWIMKAETDSNKTPMPGAAPDMYEMPTSGAALSPEIGSASHAAYDLPRLKQFHDDLLDQYTAQMSGERNVLFRMKEIWSYMIALFPDNPKAEKRIKKSTRLAEYKDAVDMLFSAAI